MNNVLSKKKITCGVYEYTYASGDVIRTCGTPPIVVFDALHPEHNNQTDENCWLNGELMPLSVAKKRINAD